MHFKLCGKSYEAKMTLAAMKMFKERTDKDLWFTLISVLHCFTNNMGKDLLTVTKSLALAVDPLTAAELLYCLAKQENKSLGIEEFEDGVMRCGWRPIEGENTDSVEPYTFLLVDVAQQVDKQMHTLAIKKKERTGLDSPAESS